MCWGHAADMACLLGAWCGHVGGMVGAALSVKTVCRQG